MKITNFPTPADPMHSCNPASRLKISFPPASWQRDPHSGRYSKRAVVCILEGSGPKDDTGKCHIQATYVQVPLWETIIGLLTRYHFSIAKLIWM